MADQQHFEQIYFNTYQKVLKYIVIHCSNIEDVNDIVQETYIELNNLLVNYPAASSRGIKLLQL